MSTPLLALVSALSLFLIPVCARTWYIPTRKVPWRIVTLRIRSRVFFAILWFFLGFHRPVETLIAYMESEWNPTYVEAFSISRA